MPTIEQGTQTVDAEAAHQRILLKAGVPSGTDFNNIAEKGQLCIDTTNAKLYINTGTKASNTWTVVGTQT
jgi:hypothetical protein